MGESSQEVVRRAYDAFAIGDVDAVMALLAEDIAFHIPGTSPLAGEWAGHDGVLRFFTTAAELSGGTMAVGVDDLLGDDEQVAALVTVTARRNGRSESLSNVHLLRVVDGKIAGLREYMGDERREDEFWTS
jgi:ketosteroid isomerase-like protein